MYYYRIAIDIFDYSESNLISYRYLIDTSVRMRDSSFPYTPNPSLVLCWLNVIVLYWMVGRILSLRAPPRCRRPDAVRRPQNRRHELVARDPFRLQRQEHGADAIAIFNTDLSIES